jgi:probable rRNA maturation factor
MARPALTLSLQFADASDKSLLPRHKVQRWLAAALLRPAQITVRCVEAVEGRNLNHDYRGADHATNVLTFAYQSEPKVVADLVLCSPVIRREAAEREIDLQAHYAHLVVHGALHAQGLDHQDLATAHAMETAESEILTALGLRDPHRA